MVVCAACGAENRDRAKFCKGCARPLVPLAAGAREQLAPGPEAMALCPACHVPNPVGSTTCSACLGLLKSVVAAPHGGAARKSGGGQRRRGLLLGAGLAAVALVAGGWWLQRPAPAMPAMQAAMPAPVRLVTAPTPPAETALVPGGARSELPAGAQTTRALAQATAPDVQPAARAPVRPEAKAPTPRKRPAGERQRGASDSVQSASGAETGSARTEPAQRPAVMPEPARAAEAAQGVDQACAGSSNFITRDICRLKACSDPARAGDAVCVRFRQMEEANRQRQRN